MEGIVEGLMTKAGLTREQAEQVMDYLKNNSGKVLTWLQESGVKDKLPGGLGKLF